MVTVGEAEAGSDSGAARGRDRPDIKIKVKSHSTRMLPGIQRLGVREQLLLLAVLLSGLMLLVALLDSPMLRLLVTLPGLLALVFLIRQINLGLREPLRRITQVAGRWHAGDFAARASLRPDGELGRLAALLNALVEGLQRDLAKRDAAERALRASEERFRTLTELSSDWYWEQDVEYRFTFMAGSSDDPMNVTRWMRIGKTRWELPSFEVGEEVWRAHKAQLEARAPFRNLELRRRDETGSVRWISVSGAPIFDASGFAGYRGVGRDITARKLAEQALRESEEWFRSLTEFYATYVWELDEQMHFAMIKGRGLDELGVSAEDAIGRTTPDFATRAGMTPINMSWEALETLRAQHLPYSDLHLQRVLPDGEVRYLSAWAEPIYDSDGRFKGYRGLTRDITDQMRRWIAHEQELRATNAALEERVAARTADLVAANHELEAFAYTVSHDLRAPLRFIGTHAHVLQDELGSGASPRSGELLLGIVEGTRRLAELIDRLLEFSRLWGQPLQRMCIDVKLLVSEVLDAAAPDIGRCEIVVGELPKVPADPVLLRQAIANLVSNAIKFSARRRKPRVEIGCEHRDGVPVFYVRDNGVGFPVRYAEKAFEVFRRLHGESQFPGGVGAGLAVTKRIVERHGGRIWAESKVGKGATFRFTLVPSLESAS